MEVMLRQFLQLQFNHVMQLLFILKSFAKADPEHWLVQKVLLPSDLHMSDVAIQTSS
jgi:hypothetical protein